MSKTMKFVISMLLIAVIALSFGAGYQFGYRSHSDRHEGLDVVEQAWDIIFNDYVDREHLDAETLRQAAIEGMVTAIDDPYTAYLNVENYQLGLSSLEGEFDGIGAHVTFKDGKIEIVAPIAGSPAEKAGIRAGDIILTIDGMSTEGMSLTEAVLKIRGPEGTSVRLLVLHQDDPEPVEVEIVRATVELQSVLFEMKGDIAYISINQFSERTDKELIPILESINEEGKARGVILDLRNNPGGLLDVVVDVAGHFLSEGVMVDVVSNQGKISSLRVKPREPTTELPMIVLVNEYSASGSEVLSGALQDYGRAIIAGNKTYGKGSVNILRRLIDGSGLYITTARWLTPNGRLIEGEGIAPDSGFELELSGEDAIRWAVGYLTSNE